MSLAPWLPLLLPLAVARLTSILVVEDIVARPRQRIATLSRRRARAKRARLSPELLEEQPWRDPYPYRAKLVTCRWCTSVWVALLALVGLLLSPEWTARVALVFALSLLGVVLDSLGDVLALLAEDDEDTDEDEPAPPADPPAHVLAHFQEG